MLILSPILQVLTGWVYGHLMEYSIHRWALHDFFKKRNTFFSFHFSAHHKDARKNRFKDPAYDNPLNVKNAAGKELLSLSGLLLIHAPIALFAPWFFGVAAFSICSYYYHHYRAHTNPSWAKKHLPWHYDHHMGFNQDMNYGVRTAIFDRLFGTYKPFLGTSEYKRLLEIKQRADRKRKR